jgi:hypothetical protein
MKTCAVFAGAAVWLAAAPALAAVRLVCNANCPSGFDPAQNPTHYATLSAAATAAQDGDTILVWPGVYREGVHIRGRTHLRIRGMDRYGVLLDGDADGDGSYAANHEDGIKVGSKADPAVEDIVIENLSGTGYFGQPFFWENVRGFQGRYLTAFANRRYGLYALSSEGSPASPGVFEFDYVYGHGDGGFYIGECSPCNAVIRRSWADRNALGYSGTNAGGNLVLEDSIWSRNRIGILPNTLDGESHVPQRGVTIRNNLVVDNNFPDAPRVSATAIAPDGIGIGIAGGMANQIYGNTVHGNGRYGIAVFWLFTPPQHNMVFDNIVYGNGHAVAGGADLADAGPGSAYNCFTDNETDTGGSPTTDPPNLQEFNSCRSNLFGPFAVPLVQSPAAAASLGLAAGQGQVTFELGQEGTTPPASEIATPLTPGLSPARAAAVACLPNPCEGIPDNAFCSGGMPVSQFQASAECAAQ